MKTIDHQIVAWPQQILDTYKMWVMLDRCRLENEIAISMLAARSEMDMGGLQTIEELKEKFYTYLVENNLPCRVEASNDFSTFTATIVSFKDVFKYIFDHDALSLVFYPTHYPTREAHNEDIEKEYIKVFGE